MDLVLLERFLSSICPDEGKTTVNAAFSCIRAPLPHQLAGIGGMIGSFQMRTYDQPETIQVSNMQALLTGMMIAFSATVPELRQHLLVDFIERAKKLRGENVVGFFDEKAKRGK